MKPSRRRYEACQTPFVTLLAAAVAVLALLAGCTEGDDPVERVEEEEPTTTAPTTGDDGPDGPAVEPIEWEECGQDRQCATVTVPLDYDDADGDTLDLAVARLPATGERLGSLFVNFGGPGGSAADIFHLYPYPDEVLEHFDLVGMDPRGVGQSTPLNCGIDPETLYAADPTMEDDADRAAFVDISETYVDDCTSERGDVLPHLGTRNVARDMDRIRAAMGDDTLNFLGYSYGTSIGQAYADLFPDRVRAMIIDGLVDPAHSGLDAAIGQAEGFEIALANWADGCADRGCPLDDPVAAVERALRVAEGGVPAGDETVGPGEMATGLAYPLYSETLWPQLDRAIDGMLSDDGSDMLDLARSYTGLVDFSIYFAVSCLDSEWPDDPAAFFDAGKDADSVAPHFGEAIVVDYLRCALWPDGAEPLGAIEAPGAPPILVVSTTGDPATPHVNGVAVADRLESGVLVVHEGDGHTVVFSGVDGCIDDLAVDYLVDLDVPDDGVTC